MTQKVAESPPNFLVLNSLTFFQKSWEFMEKHECINLYLDRDEAGVKLTKEALERNPEKFTDQSILYKNHKDLNDWLSSLKHLKLLKSMEGLYDV